jgi:hypothetical protein
MFKVLRDGFVQRITVKPLWAMFARRASVSSYQANHTRRCTFGSVQRAQDSAATDDYRQAET